MQLTHKNDGKNERKNVASVDPIIISLIEFFVLKSTITKIDIGKFIPKIDVK